MSRVAVFVVGAALASCVAAGPAAPADPLALCLARTSAGDPVAARDAVEVGSDVRVAAAPLGEEGARALFGTSTPAAASLWSVTIDVRKLPAGAHLLIEPPRFVRACQETSARWDPMWPSTRQMIFPAVAPLERSRADRVPVPPLHEAVEPPSAIKPGEDALWDKLEEATGQVPSRKHKRKLTSAEQAAWRSSEESKRAAARAAHDAAVTENQRRAGAFEQERVEHEAAVAASEAAREALGRLSAVTCDPPQSIGPSQIVFATAARCHYVSLPTVSAPPAGTPCQAPVSFFVGAQWALDAPGRTSCAVDGSSRRLLADDATPAELTTLFAGGPLPLARLRGGP